MYYNEYLRCADKHLKSCQSFLTACQPNVSKDFEMFYDLYYLTGYIIEGLTIYSAYKLYQWQSCYEIDDLSFYDPAFIQRANLDFYQYRWINGSKICPRMKVKGHNFQQIASTLLRNQGPFANDNTTPYFANGPISPDVLQLIDKWRPETRYLHRTHSNLSSYPVLTQDLLRDLVDTCNLMLQQTILLIGI